jgi:hypothetical protein
MPVCGSALTGLSFTLSCKLSTSLIVLGFSDTYSVMRMAFMKGATSECKLHGLPKLHEVFDDEVETWIGYPLTTEVVPDRPTLYLRERCRLAHLLQQMHDLILAPNAPQDRPITVFATAIENLFVHLQQWYEHLPFELHYAWPMSISVWELQ